MKVPGLPQPSKNSSVQMGSSVSERLMLARMPLGGSFVILTPFCSTKPGKALLGLLVSQSRKCASTRSGESSSQMRSRVGIQLTQRWQFSRHTHFPECCASWMACSAFSPWPWPSDMLVSLSLKPTSSASLSSSSIGAAPGVSTKTSGVVQLLSL